MVKQTQNKRGLLCKQLNTAVNNILGRIFLTQTIKTGLEGNSYGHHGSCSHPCGDPSVAAVTCSFSLNFSYQAILYLHGVFDSKEKSDQLFEVSFSGVNQGRDFRLCC